MFRIKCQLITMLLAVCLLLAGFSVVPSSAKLSIPIFIYVTSPGQPSFRFIGSLRRYVIVSLNTLD
jgi:hypothetical protein